MIRRLVPVDCAPVGVISQSPDKTLAEMAVYQSNAPVSQAKRR